MTTTAETTRVDIILGQAKKEPIKGRYYVYERYKSQLQAVCEDYNQLERALIELARILRV